MSVVIALAQKMTVALNPSPGQTASGTTTLTAVSSTAIRVDVTVRGLTPNTTLSKHIHAGACTSLGGTPHSILSDLVADAQGNASASTTLNASFSDLAELGIIAPHVAAGGSPIVCGTIPAMAAAPAATPAAVTPAALPPTAPAAPATIAAPTAPAPAPTAAPAVVVAGATALPATGGLPLPLHPPALLGDLAVAIGTTCAEGKTYRNSMLFTAEK